MARHGGVLGRDDYQLNASIAELHRRYQRLNRLSYTHDEFLALFAPPEDWTILKTAADIADVTASGGSHEGLIRHHAINGEAAELSFYVRADGAPLMPRNHDILTSAPPELIERLTSWVNREIEVAIMFTRAKALMNWLSYNCETKGQIRFLWPSIVALCSLSESTAQLGDRLREFKTPSRLPSLPLEVRNACKLTSGAIATAMLLDAEEAPWAAPVKVNLTAAEFRSVEGTLGHLIVGLPER